MHYLISPLSMGSNQSGKMYRMPRSQCHNLYRHPARPRVFQPTNHPMLCPHLLHHRLDHRQLPIPPNTMCHRTHLQIFRTSPLHPHPLFILPPINFHPLTTPHRHPLPLHHFLLHPFPLRRMLRLTLEGFAPLNSMPVICLISRKIVSNNFPSPLLPQVSLKCIRVIKRIMEVRIESRAVATMAMYMCAKDAMVVESR